MQEVQTVLKAILAFLAVILFYFIFLKRHGSPTSNGNIHLKKEAT